MTNVKVLFMKRQNSVPQAPHSSLNYNQRRKSHDILGYSIPFVCSSVEGTENMFENTVNVKYEKGRPISSILVTDSGVSNSTKRVTLTEDNISIPSGLPTTPSATLTFGYASVAHKISSNCELEPSTSEAENEADSNIEWGEHQIGLFFVRNPEGKRVMRCHQPVGVEADQFLDNIANRSKEKIRKYLETEAAEDSEQYLWIQTEANAKITVLSLTQLKNHFGNEKTKRVKWRHLSMDRITVYRYSVPVITTKFRLRVMHFFTQNYRCCILCVWFFVILFISIGIVLSVVFGSAPYMNTVARKNATTGYMFTR